MDDGRDQPRRASRRGEPARRPPVPAELVAPAVLGLCVLVPLVEVGRFLAFSPYTDKFVPAVVAAALITPLVVHLVRHQLGGTRAPYGRSVFAVILVVTLVAAFRCGEGWSFMLVFPALAAFLELSWQWAAAVLVGMEVTVLLIGEGGLGGGWNPVYYAFSVGFRVTAFLALIATVAAHRQLQATREQLRDAAVMRERMRIDDDVHRIVAPLLSKLAAAAPRTERELTDLVDEARTTLAAARRTIVGYQRQSMARELDTATVLLELGGAPTRVVAPSVELDRPASDSFRRALRAAVSTVLAQESGEPIDLVVARDGAVELRPRDVA